MINQMTVLGRVGKIDTRRLQNGTGVTNVSIVTSKKFVKDGEKQEKVTWHNVTLFSKLSEIAEKYVGIGDLLYVQGEIENQKYAGQDGSERVKTVIIGHDIKLMPKSKEHKPEPKKEPFHEVKLDDEIPF